MNRSFKAGYRAYLEGDCIDDNLFDDGTDEALQFVEGWLEAERFDSTNALGVYDKT